MYVPLFFPTVHVKRRARDCGLRQIGGTERTRTDMGKKKKTRLQLQTDVKKEKLRQKRAKAKQQPAHDDPPATPPPLSSSRCPPRPLTLSRVERAPAHSDRCLQVGASGFSGGRSRQRSHLLPLPLSLAHLSSAVSFCVSLFGSSLVVSLSL